MLTTPRTSPARKSETNVKRSVMSSSCAREIPAEPRQRGGPRAPGRLEIRAGLRVLRPQKTVSRAGVYLRLIGLAHDAHCGVGWGDRGVDALVVLAVKPEHRSADS